MVKKAVVVALVLAGTGGCATYTPAPPLYHVEDIPQAISSRLPLDQRIAAGEVWAALRSGRVAQARKAIERLGPAGPVFDAGMGYISLLSSDLDGAEKSFQESSRSAPGMTAAAAGLAQIYEARGWKDLAFEQYKAILAADPENRWAKPRFEALRGQLVADLESKAKSALDAGRRDEAKAAYLKILAYEPGYAGADAALARIAIEEKNTPEALAHLKAALAREPGSKPLLRTYADLLYASGDYGLSLETYQKLSELEPQDKDLAGRIEELKARLGFVELPSQYKAIADTDAVTREDLAALIAVKFKDFFNIPERQTQILVDIATSWAQKFIVKVASLNVMTVYDNHTFQPRRIINRAELAETLSRLTDFLKGRGARFVPLLETRRIQIADVSPDNFYYQPIVKVVSYQIMDLTPDRLFEPERTVSGEEASRILDVVLRLAR